MRTFFSGTLFALALLAASGAARAQYRGPYGNPSYRDQPGYGRPHGEFDVVARVLGHLDRARTGGWWSRGDTHHYEHARNDLMRFQDDLARGRFDQGRLDSAIGHLNHLAGSHQVPPRDRELLARDGYDLREFRSRRGGWSGRY
jgi:hypothetical protein